MSLSPLRTLFLLLISCFLPLQLSVAQESFCQEAFERELQDFLAQDGGDFLNRFYALTIIQMAAEVRFERRVTVEEMARTKRQVLTQPQDEQRRLQLESLYRRYGLDDDLNQLEESLQAANPWRASLRLNNQRMSQVLLGLSLTEPEGPWNASHAAVVWLVHRLLEEDRERHPPGSAQYNQLALSSSVNLLLSASPPPSGHEILQSGFEQLKELEQIIDTLKQQFLEDWADQCAPWLASEDCLGLPFLWNQVLPEAITQLARRTETLTLLERTRGIEALVGPEGLRLSFTPLSLTLTSERPTRAPGPEHFSLEHLPENVRPRGEAIRVAALRQYEQDFSALESEAQKLHHFHRDLAEQEQLYGVIDRTGARLSFYRAGTLVYQTDLLDPPALSDQHRHGGAGRYRYAYHGAQTLFFLTDEADRNVGFRLSQEDQRARELLESSDILYVLPVEEVHQFRLRDGQLIFSQERQVERPLDYNFSPRQTQYRPLTTLIANPDHDTPVARAFVQTLDREKARLMELYGIDNDDYNELARLSFGILANESDLGRSPRYWIKEQFPWLVSLLKGEGLDTRMNSRGPTQIKTVPALIAEHYGVTKESLHRPEHAAVATLGFLAQSLSELRNRERNHPDITPYNRLEYLHYIYTGRAYEISRGTATPERNIYYRNMRLAAESLIQWEGP